MLNSRQFFRCDVVLPMHMERVDRYGQQICLKRRQLISREDEAKLHEINDSLKGALSQVFERSPAASQVFTMLNARLGFMWWMLDFIMESDGVKTLGDYRLRFKKDAEFNRPTSKKTSNIAPLILGLFDAIDESVLELCGVMQSRSQNGSFVYKEHSQKRFDDKSYVVNLDELASSGILPARILQWLVEKFNIQLSVLEGLKDAYRKTSSPAEWRYYQVNLSATGCEFMTNDAYEVFSNMDIYMDIRGHIVICRGKIVSQEFIEGELLDSRVSVEFDVLTGKQAHEITLFFQYNELKESMSQVVTPYTPPLNA